MNELNYTIVRSRRRKTATIIVRLDSSIEVRVPEIMPINAITALVNTKKTWISNKQRELQQSDFQPQSHRYVAGEQFLLRGKLLTLAIDEGRKMVIIEAETIRVTVPPGLVGEDRRVSVATQIGNFYLDEARRYLRQRTSFLAKEHGFQPIYVGVKEYRSRWGCCFGDGRIYFNWKLILAPERIIDYVIIHELCHLRIRSHAKEYWQLVATILPDWQNSRRWLHRNGYGLEL